MGCELLDLYLDFNSSVYKVFTCLHTKYKFTSLSYRTYLLLSEIREMFLTQHSKTTKII